MENNYHGHSVSILLISDRVTIAENMRKQLEDKHECACTIWECADLSELFRTTTHNPSDIDIILVDFALIGSGRPREIFQKMMKTINNVPIIVFNSSSEHDIALFVIEEGAAESITSDQLIEENFSLFNIIERCLVRVQNTRRLQIRNLQEMEEIRRQWQSDIVEANTRNFHTLTQMQEENLEKIIEKNRVIKWISGGYSVDN